MRYNNYVLLGIIDLPVCGSIKLLLTILSLNNWTRQLWTLADVDPSPIKIRRSHREDKYILHLHMTIHIIKITYQYCVELNVGHQVLAPYFFFVNKLTPTVHPCFFSLHEIVQPFETVVYLFFIWNRGHVSFFSWLGSKNYVSS